MTDTIRVACAYAYAFAAHLRWSWSPLSAVVSSHDWYPTANRPARKSRLESTPRMASTASAEPSLFGLRSGRSETIRTSGVRPAEATSPQIEAGKGPSRGAAAMLTHVEPAPAASAWGAPSCMRVVTRFVLGSTRETSPVMKLPVHTAP